MIRKYEKDLYVIDERELKMLMEAYINLNALECAGVDNWENYGNALDEYYEDNRKTKPNYNINDDIQDWLTRVKNDTFFSNISSS